VLTKENGVGPRNEGDDGLNENEDDRVDDATLGIE
jgi:hypothetical protein